MSSTEPSCLVCFQSCRRNWEHENQWRYSADIDVCARHVASGGHESTTGAQGWLSLLISWLSALALQSTDCHLLIFSFILMREVFIQKFATRVWLWCAFLHDTVHNGYLQQTTCLFLGSSKRPKSIVSKQFCCTFKQSKLNTYIVYVYRYSHPCTQLSTFWWLMCTCILFRWLQSRIAWLSSTVAWLWRMLVTQHNCGCWLKVFSCYSSWPITLARPSKLVFAFYIYSTNSISGFILYLFAEFRLSELFIWVLFKWSEIQL